MKSLSDLFDNNRRWAAGKVARDPEFFERLANQQSPKYLWIGCADSRVPANQITGLDPGEVFVHRNVANVVVQTDFNMLSVVQYAVEVLKVEHVIVCGHYSCGGVAAALGKQRNGLIDNWLRHIQTVAREHTDELRSLEQPAQIDRLCELNVEAQAKNISHTTILQDAWDRGQKVDVHSWIYRLNTGHLSSLKDPITLDNFSSDS
ncbi:carbonate dehydratase [Verrucomicrobiaceae bacterium R5-34]|uniref:Carbonic anhydrase n=1 Tax=Oceaniferula flava TaxID=2800421 RepID=A0AAE2SAD3_9BACT|nr:carbonate dehydratase [Oceaniferula flavus]MBK1830324.1 carbonate dehydratase [Verrucomicrobiaceae bacterium R5-34]MBK1854416.1 carbonate dehydratase [Oceaniferula flavus]MBM1135722.1 carbonate dehydratase [Oceaniferula flavus]